MTFVSTLNSFDGTSAPAEGSPLLGTWELLDPEMTCLTLNARAHVAAGSCEVLVQAWWSAVAGGSSGDYWELLSSDGMKALNVPVRNKYLRVQCELVSGTCSSFVCSTVLSKGVPVRHLESDKDSVTCVLDTGALATEATLTAMSAKFVSDGVQSVYVKDTAAGNSLATIHTNTQDTAGHLSDCKATNKLRVEVMNASVAVTGSVTVSNTVDVSVSNSVDVGQTATTHTPLTNQTVSGVWASAGMNHGAGTYDVLIKINSITVGGSLYLDISPDGVSWFKTYSSAFINTSDTSAVINNVSLCCPHMRLKSYDGMLAANIDVMLAKKQFA